MSPDWKPGVEPYWLTRDRGGECDEADERIEVWIVRPVLLRQSDGCHIWVAPLDVVDRSATLVASWSEARARREVGNGVPHGTECVRVGRMPEPAQEVVLS